MLQSSILAWGGYTLPLSVPRDPWTSPKVYYNSRGPTASLKHNFNKTPNGCVVVIWGPQSGTQAGSNRYVFWCVVFFRNCSRSQARAPPFDLNMDFSRSGSVPILLRFFILRSWFWGEESVWGEVLDRALNSPCSLLWITFPPGGLKMSTKHRNWS